MWGCPLVTQCCCCVCHPPCSVTLTVMLAVLVLFFFHLDLVFELSEYTFWNCLTLGTVIGTAVTHGAWQPLVSPSLSPEELTGSRC